MTEPETPIVVNPSAMPELVGVAFRYFATILAGWLIRRGYMQDSDGPLIIGLVMAVAAMGYAAYKAWQNKAKLVTAARAAPNHVAVVTNPSPPPPVA